MRRLLTAAALALLTTTAAQAENAINFVNRDCDQWAVAQGSYLVRTFPIPNALTPVVREKLQQKDFAKNRERCEELKQNGKAAKEEADQQTAALAAQQQEQQRVMAERQQAAKEEADRQTAARAAQQQEQQRVMAEQRLHQQEEARAQAIEAAKPINRLYRGYQYYAHVKFCNEVREGYLVTYVNDVELERAETAIRAIVEQTTKEDASINTDDVWQKALKAISGRYAQVEVCKASLIELFKLSPTPVYQIAKP